MRVDMRLTLELCQALWFPASTLNSSLRIPAQPEFVGTSGCGEAGAGSYSQRREGADGGDGQRRLA